MWLHGKPGVGDHGAAPLNTSFHRVGIRQTCFPLLIWLGGLATSALGALIAADSYPIGNSPTAGQYTTGALGALKSQPANLTTPGFVTGPYNQGSGTSKSSSTEAGGLSLASYNNARPRTTATSRFTGAGLDSTVRSVARGFSPSSFPASPSSTYFFNILVSQDGTSQASANNFALVGFGNNTVPTLGATLNEVQGLYFGFAQHGTSGGPEDLVIRYRNGMDTTADSILVSGASTSTARVFDVVAELPSTSTGTARPTAP